MSHSITIPKLTGIVALTAAILLLISCNNNTEHRHGETVFMGLCVNCHAQGINGAPIVGNAKMWSARIEQGLPTLIEHANNGYGLMPAKGGSQSLSDEDVAAAVTYMVHQLD